MSRRLQGLLFLIITLTGASIVHAQVATERASVATLPEPGEHWLFVPDRLLEHSLLFDGDTGEVLGMIDSSHSLTPKPPLLARSRGEIYSADVDYARGTRGARTDYVSIYDARTLDFVAEVIIPTHVAQSNTSQFYVELLGERFLAAFNQFPNASVGIVDLESRQFVEEILVTGCAGVYPVTTTRFATLCGNGTALLVELDEGGHKARFASSPQFFDVVQDPVGMSAGRDGARWTFVTFSGRVHTVDFSGNEPRVEEAWSLTTPSERERGWRPGGLQYVALHAPSQRLYVVMHEGEPGSHKREGEIWAFDLRARKAVDRFEVPNLTAAFVLPVMGVERGTFTERVLSWLLPGAGVHTIAVSRDAKPLLFARNAELGAVAVLDGLTGETLRVLTEAGLAGPTLRVP